ncbi:hypothetical protein D9758_013493 [Tetrapyrgos nigripes]|uniref:Calcineurin-like phosphoesterase domain-containing protein n=1 Tax=Tetrapyrgos nigripes TaxID=182062 RepID=A0A8H5FRM1_9AGAR|nr:hypothetical protein D9758_013493 [Tetrapyrgos nigripes]
MHTTTFKLAALLFLFLLLRTLTMKLFLPLLTLLSTFDVDTYSAPMTRKEDINPYPDKPRLVFRKDGTFKITIFSDQHFGENPWDSWGPEHDASSINLMKTVLADEKPDYVSTVPSGDMITGENTFKENATKLIDQIVAPLNTLKIPFSTTQGNHDNQNNITHLDIIKREQAQAPLSYTRTSPPGVGGDKDDSDGDGVSRHGPGNCWVPIYQTQDAPSPSLILWFFDSRGGFIDTNPWHPVPQDSASNGLKGADDWVHESVAGWIESEVGRMDAAWELQTRREMGRGGQHWLLFIFLPTSP